MFCLKGFEKEKSLIIVTGTPASGKTTVAKLISENLDISHISVEDYFITLYNRYHYYNLYERNILSSCALSNFKLDLIEVLRSGVSVVVDYTFTDVWNKKFDEMCMNYEYDKVVVNCKRNTFNEVWHRYRILEQEKDISLRCTQFTDRIKLIDEYRLCDRYRQELKQMYDTDYYNKIRSVYSYTSKKVTALISGREERSCTAV